MRKLNKLFAMLLAIVMVVGLLAGCNGGGEDTKPSADATQPSQGGSAEATQGTEATQATEDPDAAKRGGYVKYSWYELSPTFDPYGQASWTTYMWANNNFESCLVRGEDGVVYPLVCEYEQAEDGMWLKLWVREGVKFSDGTPVTLEDVVASLQRAALFTPKVQTQLWDMVDTYEIKDGVLTFTFKEYNIATFQIFSNPRACYGGIMPKAICDKYGDKKIDDPNDCIGTGPYKLVPEESQAGVRYVFTRNEHYTICEASPDDNGYASPRRQYLDGLVCMVNNDSSSQLMALMNGDLDVLAQQDITAYKTNLEPMGFTSSKNSAGGGYYVFFNCDESRAVKDVNLRRAINAVLDYDELQYACRGDLYDPSIVSPVNCGDAYTTAPFTAKEWNKSRRTELDIAKKYLDQSSYNGETLILITDNSAVTAIFLEDLQSIGINCERQSLDNATMIAYASDGKQDWDMILRSNPYSINFPSEMNSSYYSNLHNDRVDELMDLLETVPVNSAKSVEYWNELSEILADQVPSIIFGSTIDFYVAAPGLNTTRRGTWRYWFNDWWDDPSAHMDY